MRHVGGAGINPGRSQSSLSKEHATLLSVLDLPLDQTIGKWRQKSEKAIIISPI